MLLRACCGGLGCIYLRLRGQVLALRIIQFLLRNQAWLCL